METTSIKERLQHLINHISRGNVSRFAKDAGIVPTTIHNYLKGRSPNVETLMNIQRRYRVNMNWLLTGEGEMYLGQPPEPASTQAPVPVPKIIVGANWKSDLDTLAEMYPKAAKYIKPLAGIIETGDPDLTATTLERIVECIRKEEPGEKQGHFKKK